MSFNNRVYISNRPFVVDAKNLLNHSYMSAGISDDVSISDESAGKHRPHKMLNTARFLRGNLEINSTLRSDVFSESVENAHGNIEAASGAELRDGDGSFDVNNEFHCGNEREDSVSVTCEEGDDGNALFEWWKTQEESID